MPKDDDWGRSYSEWCGRHFVALQFEIITGDEARLAMSTLLQMVIPDAELDR
jgi:hypothetical protein